MKKFLTYAIFIVIGLFFINYVITPNHKETEKKGSKVEVSAKEKEIPKTDTKDKSSQLKEDDKSELKKSPEKETENKTKNEQLDELKTDEKNTNSKNITSQIDPYFPDQNPTSRILARNKRIFKGYKGQGELIIENVGEVLATKIELKLNGNDLVYDLEEGITQKEIGDYLNSGDNYLEVISIEPEGASIKVNIPYPNVDFTKENPKVMKENKLNELENLINDDIKAGFSSAQLVVLKDGEVVLNRAYGTTKRYSKEGVELAQEELVDYTVTPETLYDIASNSKMFGTNLAIMKLVDEGKLDLNQPVATYIKDYKGAGREEVLVEDLLMHRAGYAPEVLFFDENRVEGVFYSQDPAKTRELLIKEVPFVYERGEETIYSDTDYMLLGILIEEIVEKPLDKYLEEEVYKPLGLEDTMYNPLDKGIEKDRVAATELQGNTRGGTLDFKNARKEVLQGEVHDEKAYYSMGGVSGHAGLFSTAKDIAQLSQMLLNGGGTGEKSFISSDTIDNFVKPSDTNPTFGLGWRRAANNRGLLYHFGPYASNMAYGHTGWTGSVTVIDPEHELVIVLFTNKKHSPTVVKEDGKVSFTGDSFETGKYGSIVTLIYEGLVVEN